jgi:hypothetical protein
MAHNVQLTNLVANTTANDICVLLNGGFIDVYDGTQPTTADTAIGSQVKLAVLGFSATAFAGAVLGIATANPITACTDCLATSTAAWARLYKSDHTTVVMDVTVGTGTNDIIASTTSIIQHGSMSISSLTLTMPKN